jgi:anti-anti-sigma factor
MNVQRSRSGVITFLAPDFALSGENLGLLDKEVTRCLESNELRIVIDFASVPFIDSIGLERLLDYHHRIIRAGGSLKIFNPNPLCNDILYVTRLNDYFDIYFDLDKAGRSFS